MEQTESIIEREVGYKDGYKAFAALVAEDKKKPGPGNRDMFYARGFLPGSVENLDIASDDYMSMISHGDYLALTYGNSLQIMRMKEAQAGELEDKKTSSNFRLRMYFRKKTGENPAMLDAYLYDQVEDKFLKRLAIEGTDAGCDEYSRAEVLAAYEGLCRTFLEDARVTIGCVDFAKENGIMIFVRLHDIAPFPMGVGFGPVSNEYLSEINRKQVYGRIRRRGNGLSRKLHRFVFNVKRLKVVSKGFTSKRAEEWMLNQAVDEYLTRAEHKDDLMQARSWGFTLRTARALHVNEFNYQDFVSEEEYNRIMPVNIKYGKWIQNLATIYYVFKPFRQYMAEVYYHVMPRDGAQLLIPYGNMVGEEDHYQAVKRILDEKGAMNLNDVYGNRVIRLRKKDEDYYLGRRRASFDKIWDYITDPTRGEAMLMAPAASEGVGRRQRLYVYIYNKNGQGARMGNMVLREYNEVGQFEAYKVNTEDGSYERSDFTRGRLEQFNEIKEMVAKMGDHVPQLEYFAIDFVIRDGKIYIKNILNNPEYPVQYPFSKELTAFLKEKFKEVDAFYSEAANVSERTGSTGKRRARKDFAKLFYPKGLLPYLSLTWPKDVWKDFTSNKDCSFADKMWAYRHGFLSYRLAQYGITRDNWEDYISDFEYKWIRHINPHYKTWMEDKITIKYIAHKYNQYFPDYYYHIVVKNDEINVIPLMDCPSGFGKSLDDVINLVKEKGVMAFKPDEGSHGDGFFRCDYENGKFYVNYEESTEEEIKSRLSVNDSAYIVTEYIQMHDQLKEIYSGSVNTIRMIVFKRDGIHPQIGNAYMRIGTKATGTVDNISAGGMFAPIDINTGHYGDAKIFIDGDIRDCDHHPDTGTLIDGTIPNWELTKELVLSIASEIAELEWYGFDLAVTQDGIKIPEINRSPDYPKMECYTRPVIDYLLYKLDMKKAKYGYLDKPNRTIVHLPRRKVRREYV